LSAALGSQSQTDKDAFTAGLLHDVGMLVLASHDPAGLAATLASAQEQQRPVYQVERERQGLTHADVGAHLLALWGLPPTVIEAVASHHDEDWQGPFDGGAVVYVADILVRELEVQHSLHSLPIPELDIDYLERVGVADRLPSWRALAAQQFFEGGG
jgi:HD-like signal output (HDOD) protein